jgi:hypothetical protein
VLQFLLQKAGLSCAPYLPIDLVMNGIYRTRTGQQIRHASVYSLYERNIGKKLSDHAGNIRHDTECQIRHS